MIKKKAFTLFELLVSISIIGILVAVASTSYGAAQKKARDTRRMEDLNNIQKALEQYYGANGANYPATSGNLGTTYIQSWPKDPKSGSAYTYQFNTPLAGSYCVCTLLDSGNGNSSDAVCSTFVASGGAYYCVKSQQ